MPSPTVQEVTRVTPALSERLAAAAKATGRPKAELVREALERLLEELEGGTR